MMENCPLRFDDYAENVRSKSVGKSITDGPDLQGLSVRFTRPRTRPIYGLEYGSVVKRLSMPLTHTPICYRCGRPFSFPFCIPLQDSGDAKATKLLFDPNSVIDAPHWSTVELESRQEGHA